MNHVESKFSNTNIYINMNKCDLCHDEFENPVFMEKFVPHVTEYARSVIDLMTIYVSLMLMN